MLDLTSVHGKVMILNNHVFTSILRRIDNLPGALTVGELGGLNCDLLHLLSPAKLVSAIGLDEET